MTKAKDTKPNGARNATALRKCVDKVRAATRALGDPEPGTPEQALIENATADVKSMPAIVWLPKPGKIIDRGEVPPHLMELAPSPSTALQVAAPTSKSEKPAKWRTVPESWQPSEAHRALAKSLGVDLASQLAQFRDRAAGPGHTSSDVVRSARFDTRCT